jgi:hypothetical protein
VDIYSIKGQHIKAIGTFGKGSHTIIWNGRDESGKVCSSGFYLIKYRSKELTKMVKVMLLQ